MAFRAPESLVGDHVELIPLALEHADELARAAAVDRDTYGFTEVPDGVEAMRSYITKFLAQAETGATVPFAQRRRSDGALVGCTRYLEIRRWRGRDEPDEVEIGGTWLSADAQRSAINTEAKLLLLSNAFDGWGVVRVALCTDAGNERSRAAITRLGASFEGILRNHRPLIRPGEALGPRQTAIFSIIDSEWPDVRRHLRARLDGAG